MSELMSDDDDETVILTSSVIVVHFCVIAVLKRKRLHSERIRGYLQSRTKYCAHNCLMPNLQVHAEDKLQYYIRMDLSTFDELFTLLKSLIGFV